MRGKEDEVAHEILKIYKEKVAQLLTKSELTNLNMKIHREDLKMLILGENTKDFLTNVVTGKIKNEEDPRIDNLFNKIRQMGEIYMEHSKTFLKTFFMVIKGEKNQTQTRVKTAKKKTTKTIRESALLEENENEEGKNEDEIVSLTQSILFKAEHPNEEQNGEKMEKFQKELKCIEDFKKLLSEMGSGDVVKQARFYNFVILNIFEIRKEEFHQMLNNYASGYSVLEQMQNEIMMSGSMNIDLDQNDEKVVEEIDIFTFVQWFGDDEE